MSYYTETNVDVPRGIILACKQLRWKKQELADFLGISTKTLYRYRLGLRLAPRLQRQTLAVLLNTSMVDARRR